MSAQKARSLYHEIVSRYPCESGKKQAVNAPIMSAVADVLDAVRLLLSWLDRRPFESKSEFHRVRTTLISLSLELATNAQRDTFAEQPVDVIRLVSLNRRRFLYVVLVFILFISGDLFYLCGIHLILAVSVRIRIRSEIQIRILPSKLFCTGIRP